jgi:hypothetical protein
MMSWLQHFSTAPPSNIAQGAEHTSQDAHRQSNSCCQRTHQQLYFVAASKKIPAAHSAAADLIVMADGELKDKMAAVAVADAPDHVAEKKQYYQKRIDLFSQYVDREKAQIDAARAANVPIKVVLPDGSVKPGIKGATTPLDIANEISKSLAKKCVVAKVDGETWDLFRPLEGDCTLSLLNFDDPDGREVSYWPSHGDYV